MTRVTDAPIRLGLRANLAQFTLLVAVNALVGGMIGQERTVLPLLADAGLRRSPRYTAALTFIVAFGITKAATNFFAGTLSDRYGRKPVLVAGWLDRPPRPAAADLGAVVGLGRRRQRAARRQPGPDLVHHGHHEDRPRRPARRGLAMGFNEAAGYVAVAATALATGVLAAHYGLRPAPFLLGMAYAALGLGLSTVFVRETRGHARHEARQPRPADGSHDAGLSTGRSSTLTSSGNRRSPSASQAGLVNNLNDGLAWGLFPILFAAAGLSVARIGDPRRALPGRVGPRPARHRRAVRPLRPQTAHRRRHAAASRRPRLDRRRHTASPPGPSPRSCSGAGTAMVYPTLLAAIGDVAHPAWRARAVGVYRLWRDGGYAVGALLAGILADAVSASAPPSGPSPPSPPPPGCVVAVRMYETHRPSARRTSWRHIVNTHPVPAAEPIYLDYNATTPIDPRVVDAMQPYLTAHFGNPSSAHAYASAPPRRCAPRARRSPR